MIEKYPRLSAFVGDGLPAGLAGLAHFKPDSITADNYGIVFFVQCNNHILNLSFERACSKDNNLTNLVTDLDKFIILLRKPFFKKYLNNIKAPSFPKTMWLYIFDELLWIKSHEKMINNALTNARKEKTREFDKITDIRKIPEIFYHLLEALRPIKKLQLAYENEKIALPFVYPLLVITIRKYETMVKSTKLPQELIGFATTILSYLISTFKEKARIPLLVFSFALSPLGARYINGTDWGSFIR